MGNKGNKENITFGNILGNENIDSIGSNNLNYIDDYGNILSIAGNKGFSDLGTEAIEIIDELYNADNNTYSEFGCSLDFQE